MRKLATAAILAAALAMVMSGAALWRTRHLSSSKNNSTVSNGSEVAVPDATNKIAYVAGAEMSQLKLKYKLTRTPSATVAKSMVISQNPAPGTKVPPGTQVELTVSSGPP
jgi:hypothetical protein